jgi:hypothetical protein
LGLHQKTNNDSVHQGKTFFLSPDHLQKHTTDSVKPTNVKDTVITVKPFLQESPVNYHVQQLPKNNSDWIIYVLLVFSFFISLIWYYLPERIVSLVNITPKARDYRNRDNSRSAETPGIVILLFLIINYYFTLSLFLFLSTTSFNIVLGRMLTNDYFLFFLVAVISYYAYRLIVIYFTGFIFNTAEVAAKQIKLYVNIDNLTGLLYIPIIFLMIFLKTEILIYLGILILVFFQIYKWLQTFILGKSIQGFSVLHLFMYLCTLEIVPLIVLIKLYLIRFD